MCSERDEEKKTRKGGAGFKKIELEIERKKCKKGAHTHAHT